MQLRRNEIMTGLLVLSTVAVLCFILILLGAPGLFRPLIVYKLYFDNAAGIKLGSPVSREDAAHALEAAANLGSVSGGAEALPRLEVRIDIEVDRAALVYKNSN